MCAHSFHNTGTITSISNVDIDVLAAGKGSTVAINNNHGTIGSISNLSIVVDSTTASSAVYGINNSGDIGDISNIDIQISGGTGSVYGIRNATYGSSTQIGSFDSLSGSISVSGSSYCYALYQTGAGDINFNGDTSLKASGTSSSKYALYSTGSLTLNALSTAAAVATLSLEEEDSNEPNPNIPTITIDLTGNISVAGELSMESGAYVINERDGGVTTTITATSMSISSGASLTLNTNTTFAITDNTLSFILSDLNEYTMLTIDEAVTISGLDYINIVLAEGLESEWSELGEIAIIDADVEALEGITFAVYDYEGNLIDATVSATDFIIPEPSTATLSLLALTALCLRRRRQG